jgi:hypothetical protein
MNKKRFILNWIKFVVAIIVGGFLGVKLLASGEPALILLFFVLCFLGGTILSKVGENAIK